MSVRAWAYRISAAVLGALVPLAAIEGYLRLTGPGGGFYEPDPALGARLIPNATGRWRRACFDVPIRINSQGLRDVEHPIQKPPETERIAVLGDSIAEALQVPLEESFPRRLEELLNAAGRRPRGEVINFGVSGYGSDQEYLVLKTRAAAYQPDVVVLAFTIGNDVRNNSPRLERQMSSYPKPFFRLDAGGHLVHVPIPAAEQSAAGILAKIKGGLRALRLYDLAVGWVRTHPSVVAFLAKVGLVQAAEAPPPHPGEEGQGVGPNMAYVDASVYLSNPGPDWEEAWGVTEALIRVIRTEAEHMGARFVLVSIPPPLELATSEALLKELPDYTPARYDLDRPRARLKRLAEAEGLEYISMYDVFAADLRARQQPLESIYFWCDGHLNPRGHHLVAQAIAERLRRQIPR